MSASIWEERKGILSSEVSVGQVPERRSKFERAAKGHSTQKARGPGSEVRLGVLATLIHRHSRMDGGIVLT